MRLPPGWAAAVCVAVLLAPACTEERPAPPPRAAPSGSTPARATPSPSREPDRVPEGKLVFHGRRESKMVALTFDADMTPGMRERLDRGAIKSSYDRRVIKILRRTRSPATIFAAGMWIERYPRQTRKLAADRLFEFANHSYRHSAFTSSCYGLPVLAPARMSGDVRRTDRLLDRHVPGHTRYFRFPGGCYDRQSLSAVAKAGVIPVQWDAVSGDAFERNPVAVARRTLAEARSGSIVVLHLNGAPTAPATYAALPQIIAGLRARGLRLVKLSELLAYR